MHDLRSEPRFAVDQPVVVHHPRFRCEPFEGTVVDLSASGLGVRVPYVDVTDAQVTFRWKDYAHHNKRRTMTLTHEEFLRRFLQHVLPRGLPRIRYFGFLANRRRGVL